MTKKTKEEINAFVKTVTGFGTEEEMYEVAKVLDDEAKGMLANAEEKEYEKLKETLDELVVGVGLAGANPVNLYRAMTVVLDKLSYALYETLTTSTDDIKEKLPEMIQELKDKGIDLPDELLEGLQLKEKKPSLAEQVKNASEEELLKLLQGISTGELSLN